MRHVAAFLLLALILAGGATSAGADDPVVVFVVTHPLELMAGRIGGDDVDVHFPAPADVDPAHWQPSAETVSRYQAADLILRNGAAYASWIATATLPRRRLVDTTGRVRDQLIRSAKRGAVPAEFDSTEEDAIGKAVLAGFPDRVARQRIAGGRRQGDREILLALGGSAVLSDASVVHEPEWLVAVDAEQRGSRPLVETNNKEIVTSLREIAGDEVHIAVPEGDLVEEGS